MTDQKSNICLGLLRDLGKANRDEANKLLNETTEMANILEASKFTLTHGAGACAAQR